MKWTVTIFMLAACIQVSAGGYTQDRITMARKNASLPSVLEEIENQTGYHYFFNSQWEAEAKRISIDVTNADLKTVLDICFKGQPFSYEIVKNTIVVKKKEESRKDPNSRAEINDVNVPLIPELTGIVLNEKSEPLAGASVLVRNTNHGTFTDGKGAFVLKNVLKEAVVEVTYSGYQPKQIQLHGQSSLNLVLNISNNSLDQVQVIAYGTTTKRLNTGNITTITSKEIEEQPVSNPLLALEARVPGMFVSQATGLAGSAVTVQIRGTNSISNGNDPLYIIDGVPYTAENYLPSLSTILGSGNTTQGGQFTSGSPFSNINPADIESIDILKDADATAIYGSRGANGVVLITTKKGKIGQTRLDFNVQSGTGSVGEKMKLLNTRQYLDMRQEAFKNDGTIPDPNADYDLTLWDTTQNTDWQKKLIGGSANYTDVQGAASGGNANTQFLIGAGYHRETTVFPGDFNDQRGSLHFNINNISPNQRFKILLSGLYSIDNNQLCGYDLTGQALQLAPDAPAMYNPDGSINWAANSRGVSTWPGYNPAAMMLLRYKTLTNNLVSNAMLTYHVITGLDIKSSFGYTNIQSNEVQTIPLSFYAPSARPFVQRTASFADNNTHSWIIEPQITYTRPLSEGTLSGLIGVTIQQNTSNGQMLNGSGFNSDLILNDIQAATVVTVVSKVNSVYKYNAGFGRINYNWKDKYILNLTARRDGTSRFGPADQFHDFGAFGAAWVFSKEDFVRQNLPFLSFGKFRGSFGTTGNDQVGDYTFMDLYTPVSAGVPYQGAFGSLPTRIFTPNLSWEETRKLEFGSEIGLLQDRIFFAASFYRNRSSNELVSYSLPSITGFTSVEKNLAAVVQNKGWEFELKTVNVKTKNLRWTSSFNLTFNRNVLLSGAQGLSAYYQEKIGHPLSARFVYRFLGVDPITGLYEVADNHGNPTSAPNPSTDATVLIDVNPKYYGGFQNNISYKGFELDFVFQFKKQPEAANYLYNYIPGSFTSSFGGNQPVDVLNRWQNAGDVKSIQRVSQNLSVYTPWNNAQQSNQIYSDGSFIRLKNVSLSWQMPKQWQKSLHLQNARFYVHGQNLLTISNYKGLDPESLSSGTLPPLRVLTGGFQLTL